ncbi:MAG: hypothetical protein EXR98_00960 [Gemmataceae bacterium]|nr:hypothetical protein [Gemmataceae bacterium]
MGKLREIDRWGVGAVLLAVLLIGVGGCTRMFYRKQADREVSGILREKDIFPEWKIEQMHVYADPRSRYADPSDPDHPPMPPDDPAADKLSPHPQRPGKAGVGEARGTAYLELIKAWDEQNRATLAPVDAKDKPITDMARESKHPLKDYYDEPLRSPQAGFMLTLEQAVELGVINSPQYQSFREQLYLAALPVTQQRFSYAYQWAALADFFREQAGPQAQGGSQHNWTGASALGLNKLFSTGARLSADFANTTVVNLGGQGTSSVSSIGITLVQPLLQGGGKAVTLEPLTQAERNLFYSIRSYARFREQYYVSVAIGSNLPGSLASASGTSAAPGTSSVLAALGLAATDVSGGATGYLANLYRECDMASDKKFVHDLERALRILEGFQEGGMYSPLQVDQVRSTLLQAQNTVMTDKQLSTNSLDQFKLALGLPANLPLILDDTPARPVTRQLDRYYQIIDEADAAFKLVEKQDQLPAEKMRDFLLQAYTDGKLNPLVQGTEFAKKLESSWKTWGKIKVTDAEIKARLVTLAAERRTLLDLKTDLELKKATLSPQDALKLRTAEFDLDLGRLEQRVRRYEERPWEKLPNDDKEKTTKVDRDKLLRQEQIKQFRLVTHAAGFMLVWARNERFDEVYKLWPAPPAAYLEDLDLTTAEIEQAQQLAVQVALENRWDLMNARAQVMDAWRQLRVTANNLMGALTVGYSLQSQTPAGGMHPLAFSSAATNQLVSFNFQLPLNRLAQRNAYRAALINYQQARRNLIVLEDNVAAQTRSDVRQLQLFAANYQTQRKVLQSLYSQVESALEVIVAPVDPDQLKGSATGSAASAAALTSQYLGALQGLNGAQARMYGIWLSYLATRMQVYLDLERLPLDFRGVWTEELGRTPKEASVEPRPDRRVAQAEDAADPLAIPLIYIDHPFQRAIGRVNSDGAAIPTRTTPARATFGAPTASVK